MSAGAANAGAWRIGLLTLIVAGWPAPGHARQTLTVSTAADVVRIHAAGLRIIEGRVLDRLKDGRSVRVDLSLTALAGPGGPAIAEARHSFNVSYDLWEERFAVTRIGTPGRSVSHLTARAAETWCLENLTLPSAAIEQPDRKAPFWVRLHYRIQDQDPDPDDAAAGDARLSLRRLIDVLSRRREEGEPARSVDAGPFHLPD